VFRILEFDFNLYMKYVCRYIYSQYENAFHNMKLGFDFELHYLHIKYVCRYIYSQYEIDFNYTLSEAWSGVNWADPMFMTGLPER